ncbi:MAG: TIGR04063 family PEP-CTERM/XrtA system glycosyltransferase [Pseudomonadota bacterium]
MTRVLHVLDHSLPEHDGYSFRSHSILTNLARAGADVCAITSPKHGASETGEDTIDGIRYGRSVVGPALDTGGLLGQLATIRETRSALKRFMSDAPTAILHAHSPCLNGLAALGLGAPLVYEMRSSWEDASVSVGTTHEGSLRYRASRALETYVVRRADAVVVICEGLRTELVARGIPEQKISVVPNALSEPMFVRPGADAAEAIRRRYGLEGRKVIGFFGSFFEWEGVDLLVRAMPRIVSEEPDARLLIAGGGRQEETLRELTTALALDDQIVFAGRVEHADIPACYAAADVMAYPRVPHRLTEMVTPLKPLEAMAQGTIVVASDVGGHRELISDNATGLLFKAGDCEDLAGKLLAVLRREVDVDGISVRADETVRRERRWSAIVEKYVPVYARLLDANGQSA